jgi:dTDP-4-amino-4,6-dideoxygalactose transaminase
MLNTTLAPWPSFTEEEGNAVRDVLLSNKVNYWTGSEGKDFEREFADWSGSQYAIALANGTLALDLALQGLGIGSAYGGSAHDEVIVTPRTFVASASCVVNAGAVPIFADVDHDSGNIAVATIEPMITARTRAVIPVHLAGWPCAMDAIMALAEDAGICVIEDCAQAHGAMWGGRPVGSIGHIGAWSFCQDKIMTTGGEGGMVTVSDRDLWSRMWSFKDHGKSWDAMFERSHPPGFRWLHETFGTNWRLTEMQSAIGRIQLRRMEEWHLARARNADRLRNALAPFAGETGAVRVPNLKPGDNGARHAYYKFYAYVRPQNLAQGWNRDRIVNRIMELGAFAQQGSCSEIYLENSFGAAGLRPAERLPVARELGETSMLFLVHPTLGEQDMDRVCDAIGQTMAEASA